MRVMPTMLSTIEAITSQNASENTAKSTNIKPIIKEIMPIAKRIFPTDFIVKFLR